MAVTLALQVRAEWLGLTLGLLVWGLLSRRVGRVLAMGMAALAAGRGDFLAHGHVDGLL